MTALILAVSLQNDNKLLREISVENTKNCQTDAERTIALTDWVFHNKGFAKNKSYFLFSGFGPTPIQVLDQGGDCADKSRLLAAMLSTIKIPSTLAMLYPCEECPPIHTVVESKYETGWMVVDPVNNIYFPDSVGGYYGIEQLATEPELLVDRIRNLRAENGIAHKSHFYDFDRYDYKHVRTINWNKNAFTRVAVYFVSIFADDPYLVRRPQFLEDPKLLLLLICMGDAGLFFLIGFVLTSTQNDKNRL